MTKMKECEDLNSSERAVLIICCDVCKSSTNCHVPREAITRRVKLKKPQRILKTLVSSGFIVKHPTGGKMTYAITRRGIDCINQIKV